MASAIVASVIVAGVNLVSAGGARAQETPRAAPVPVERAERELQGLRERFRGLRVRTAQQGPQTRVIGTLVLRTDKAAGPRAAASGAPLTIEIPNGDVFLRQGDFTTDPVKTGLDGRFEIFTPRRGEYSVCWEIPGNRGCTAEISVDTTATVYAGAVEAFAKQFVYGKVLTGDGRPCWAQDAYFNLDFNTKVTTSIANAPAGPGTVGSPVTANIQGEYAITDAARGDHTLVAQCEGARQIASVTLDRQSARADMTFDNRAPRLGAVSAFLSGDGVSRVDPSAQVVMDAGPRDSDGDAVKLEWRTGGLSGTLGGQTATTQQWALPDAEKMNDIYAIARDGKGGYAFKRVTLPTDTGDLIFSGQVIDEVSGAPVANAEIAIGEAGAVGKTDQAGWFTVSSKPRSDDRYVINILHSDYALSSSVYDRASRGQTYALMRAQVTSHDPATAISLVDRASSGACGGPEFEAERNVRRLTPPTIWKDPFAKASDARKKRRPTRKERRAQDYLRNYERQLSRRLEGVVSKPVSGSVSGSVLKAPLKPSRDIERPSLSYGDYFTRDNDGPDRCDNRGAEVEIPAGALVRADGQPAAISVRAALTTFNPARRALPGDYQAVSRNGDREDLLSFGALDLTFTDGTGAELDLKPGTSAVVRIPVSDLQRPTAPQQISMWSFDEATGRWIEEGLAQLRNTASGWMYVGETSHFSSINMDIATDPAAATCARVEFDSAFSAWSNLTMRAYVSFNGDSVRVKETLVDGDQYHAIFRIPYGASFPPNTLRLEIRGELSGQKLVLLDSIINTDARPKMTGTNLWPSYPYAECGDPIFLSPPPIVVPDYGDIDATGRPAFLTGPRGDETFNPADIVAASSAYYAAINPPATLGDWWVQNGFGADGRTADEPASYARASYLNHNDLGFGRDMHCATKGDTLSCAVTNYGLPDNNPQNANDAVSQNPATQGATVVMTYNPNDPDGEEYAVQFAAYAGGTAGAGLLPFADLDGFGPKAIPQLCTICHGGVTQTAGNDKVIHARFREFDLPSFRYSNNRAFGFGPGEDTLQPDEKTAFAKLNEHVRDITELNNAALYPQGDNLPIRRLIDAWYPNGFNGPIAPVEPTPPPGWNAAATGLTASEVREGYHGAHGLVCRTCHVARDDGDPNAFFAFESVSQFRGDFVKNSVCGDPTTGVRIMPNASITYHNFWGDPAAVNLFGSLMDAPVTGAQCAQ
ncbi:MAG: hypothetical protein AAFY22_02660 [Pseudomonadota bacterium]